MADAVTDTHSLIWFLQNSPKLGAKASEVFEACDNGKQSSTYQLSAWWKLFICRKKDGFRKI